MRRLRSVVLGPGSHSALFVQASARVSLAVHRLVVVAHHGSFSCAEISDSVVENAVSNLLKDGEGEGEACATEDVEADKKAADEKKAQAAQLQKEADELQAKVRAISLLSQICCC